MASNTSFLRDPADQDFDDWFEIYNPNTNTVELAGYRLTDDFAQPNKYTVPPGFRIPAGGHLLIWADEEGSQTSTNGEMHVNFKLSGSGEALAIYAPDGRLVDSVTFGQQTNNISRGRWPDGAATFYFMPTPTPRAVNVIPSVAPTGFVIVLGPGNAVTLTWGAQAGRTYRVLYKDNLSDPIWSSLPGDVTAGSAMAMKSDVMTSLQRFYRIELIQ